MEVHCTVTSKWSLIARCLNSRPSSCGRKWSKESTIVTRGMWRTEMSSWRTSSLMKLRLSLNWLILAFQLVFPTSARLRFSVERPATWPPKLSAKSSILGRQPTSGLWVFCCLHCCVVDSHSKDKMIKSCTRIFAPKNYSSLIMFRRELANSWTRFSRKTLKSVWRPRIFLKINGSTSATKKWKCSPLDTLLALPTTLIW